VIFLSSRSRVLQRAIVLTVVWVLLVALALSSLMLLADSLKRNPENQNIMSLSWAGYDVANVFYDSNLTVLGINGSWVVPQVTACATNTYSSAWVGIGGQLDKTLIQIGTEHNCVNGKIQYMAWYEMLPDYATRIYDFGVSPGDTIVASISLIDPENNEWHLMLTDVTSGQVFTKDVFYDSTQLSGEWIVERPLVNHQMTSLSDFGSVTFTDAYLNVSCRTDSVGCFRYSRVYMANDRGSQLASVSPIGEDGSSFTVYFVSHN
jgi:hypothetical protein